MSLVRSKELFLEPALPVRVDSVMERTLIQNELHRHEYFEILYVQRDTLVNRYKEGEVRTPKRLYSIAHRVGQSPEDKAPGPEPAPRTNRWRATRAKASLRGEVCRLEPGAFIEL